MIEAETVLHHDSDWDYKEAQSWCEQQFGPQALARDTVSREGKTWCCCPAIVTTSFHFACERDCTMFILRWA